MNTFKTWLGIFILASIFLSSCQKDNFDLIEAEKEELKPEINGFNDLTNRMLPDEMGDGIKLGCFMIETPFDVVDEEGVTHTINEKEDLLNLRQERIRVKDFVYPLQITYEDGEARAIEDAAALGRAFAACLPGGDFDFDYFPAYAINFDNSCLTIKYPITVMKMDSSEVEIEDEATLSALLAAEEDKVFFTFPMELYDEEENIKTANSAGELKRLLLECNEGDRDYDDWDGDFSGLRCYDLVFPLEVVLINGEIKEVEEPEDLRRLLFYGKVKEFVYPLALLTQEGEEFEVASREELKAALEECEGWHDRDGGWDVGVLFFGGMECFEIAFPIEVKAYNERREERDATINNMEEFARFLRNENIVHSELIYPVTIVLDEEELVLEDADMLKAAFEDCEGRWQDEDRDWDWDRDRDREHDRFWDVGALLLGAEFCYEIVYPIEIVAYNRNREEEILNINNEEELKRLIRSRDFVFTKLVYPVTVTAEWVDTPIEIDNAEALWGLLERCGELRDDDDDDNDDNDDEEDDAGWGFLSLYRGAERECYAINFPIEVVSYNWRGEERSIEIEDMEQYERVIRNNAFRVVKLIYPVSVRTEDGELELESAEMLGRLLEGCRGDRDDDEDDHDDDDDEDEDDDDDDDEGEDRAETDTALLYKGALECYTINFPIDVKTYNEQREESTVSINDMDELAALLEDETIVFSRLVYPIDIVWTEGEREIRIQGPIMLFGLIERCF